MTRKGKLVFIVVIIMAILLKEEVYGILFHLNITNKVDNYICEIKNKNIEKLYNELVEAYKYDDNLNYELEHTKILFNNTYNLTDKITIYKGHKNNIKEKNLVINEQGLVGIVNKVNKNSSEVVLLTNKDLNLSVKINENYGILKYENNELIVMGINNKGKLDIGDKVYTSDVSNYPKNVLIGFVSNISVDNYEIEKVLKITPAVNFNNLKYLSVITDLRGQE